MKQPNFLIFPALETQRLSLRDLRTDDAAEIFQLRSDIAIAALTGRTPADSLDDAISFIHNIKKLVDENKSIYWAITFKNSCALIGAICLWNFDFQHETVELGYELLPQFQNKGLMTEAVSSILDYGFDTIGVKMITACPSDDNLRSIKLLEKAGFKPASDSYKNIHESVPGLLTFTISSP